MVRFIKERKIKKRIKAGEAKLMEDLINLYYDDVYRFCRYKVGNDDLAYDLTQETFLKFVDNFGSYKDQGSSKAYLFRIGVNVTNDYYRRKYRKEDVETDFEGAEEVKTEGDLEKDYVVADGVKRAISKLSNKQKDVIILRFYHDLKLRDIARILCIPLSTVKSRLKQGKVKLLNYLSEEGLP